MNEYKPVVVKEDSSKNFSQVLSAASRSSQEIESISFEQKEKSFELTIQQIGVIVAIVGCIAFLVSCLTYGLTPTAVLFNPDENFDAFRQGVYVTAGAGAVAFAYLLHFASRNMNATTSYNVSYSSSEQIGGTSQVTFKVELREKNTIKYRNLPQWFTDEKLFSLLALAQGDDFTFNRSKLSSGGVATVHQFKELRDAFEECKFANKSGKSYELTDAFFAFAEQAEQTL